MVHLIALYRLADGVGDEKLDDMLRVSRSLLFRVQEVHNVRTGRNIEGDNPWPFFVSMDLESMDKAQMFLNDPVWVKFNQDVVRGNTTTSEILLFETDPGKDARYS
ncbi:MAG: hypothetical protein WBE58_07190 [Verrucomicrobiales bacterium]